MKKVMIWIIVLAVCETIAVFVGQSMSSDAAAVIGGAFIGLVGAAVAAAITSMVIEGRRYSELERMSRRPRQRPEGLPRRADVVLEGEWRELGPSGPSTNAAHANARIPGARSAERAIEAPDRALVKR